MTKNSDRNLTSQKRKQLLHSPPILGDIGGNEREIIEQLLVEYTNFLGNNDRVRVELVLDRESDRALRLFRLTIWQNRSLK